MPARCGAAGGPSLPAPSGRVRAFPDLLHNNPKAFDLLTFLVQHRDRVVTKDDLLQGVWGGRIVSESAPGVPH
jgi:DNA-binding response OmpR family regulator